MLSIDKLCYNSKLRYVNAEQKIIYALITLVICVGSSEILISIVTLLMNSYLIVYKSGVSLPRFLHYLKIPFAFMILSTLSIILNFSIKPMNAFAIFLPMMGIYITCSIESIIFAFTLMLTAMASVTCLYFISFTTPMTDILMTMQKWHIPNLFIELMLLTYRYIFILLEIASNMTNAQHARLGNRNYATSIKSFGALVSMLFIRAMKKASAQYDAMESRGYDGRINVLHQTNEVQLRTTVGIILFEIVLIVLIIITKTGGGM